VSVVCRNWPTESIYFSLFQGGSGSLDFLLAPVCSDREGNSTGRPLLLNAEIRNRRERSDKSSFCPNWESNESSVADRATRGVTTSHLTPGWIIMLCCARVWLSSNAERSLRDCDNVRRLCDWPHSREGHVRHNRKRWVKDSGGKFLHHFWQLLCHGDRKKLTELP